MIPITAISMSPFKIHIISPIFFFDKKAERHTDR